ncbi:hypothetical protein HZS55_06495 [Halosimplex rubrum]|uniref:Uncharacterized protein n=1 Tax=Halosimplex rubrum TaxID=869889 RepID=A0A7D5P351_9EURY|nr:hypothetical protein HZS55_06495 [Halosimplex rubrum]
MAALEQPVRIPERSITVNGLRGKPRGTRPALLVDAAESTEDDPNVLDEVPMAYKSSEALLREGEVCLQVAVVAVVDEQRDADAVAGDVLDGGVAHQRVDLPVAHEVPAQVVEHPQQRRRRHGGGVLVEDPLDLQLEDLVALLLGAHVPVHQVLSEDPRQVLADVLLELGQHRRLGAVAALVLRGVVDDGRVGVGPARPAPGDDLAVVEIAEIEPPPTHRRRVRRVDPQRRRVVVVLEVLDHVVDDRRLDRVPGHRLGPRGGGGIGVERRVGVRPAELVEDERLVALRRGRRPVVLAHSPEGFAPSVKKTWPTSGRYPAADWIPFRLRSCPVTDRPSLAGCHGGATGPRWRSVALVGGMEGSGRLLVTLIDATRQR